MNTYLALAVLIVLVGAVWSLLERTNRRTAGLPHAPFGADVEGDADLARVQHDLALREAAAARPRLHHGSRR